VLPATRKLNAAARLNAGMGFSVHGLGFPPHRHEGNSIDACEEQLKLLKERMTIVVVTHMLRQTRRLADPVLLLWMGECIEAGTSEQVFQDPRDSRTQAYINGCIG